jgi:hypothetical protein
MRIEMLTKDVNDTLARLTSRTLAQTQKQICTSGPRGDI